MATSQSARAIGIDIYGVEVGKTADLVILDARSVSEAIGAPVGRTVISKEKSSFPVGWKASYTECLRIGKIDSQFSTLLAMA